MRLDPTAIRAGARLKRFDTLGSTNEEALACARRGEGGPLWITATQQTAGRGRRGRTWVSEPGNLHATLLLTDPSPPDRVAELSLLAALALHDAVAEISPRLKARLALKWPNDLLLDRHKVAGILVEGENAHGRLAIAIGIGVNCAHHPTGTAYPATSLSAAGATVAPDRLVAVLSRTVWQRLEQWQGGHGFETIRAGWLARAAHLGQDLRVLHEDQELAGRFETLDPRGRLVLRGLDGTARTVTAGDVLPGADPSHATLRTSGEVSMAPAPLGAPSA